MRVAFAGTPEFAAQALRALLAAGHTVPLVLTQPDRPAGRGMALQPSAVKQVALEHGLPLAQPRGLKRDGRFADDAAAAAQALADARADVAVVAAYGLIVPDWFLQAPRHGCLNLHASLLPRWRGAAPIQRAIEAGDAQTGVTLMQMDAGLDTGPMGPTVVLRIEADDTTARLHDRLAAAAAALAVRGLEELAAGRLRFTPQPTEGITYAHKIDKAEAPLDWRQPAAVLERRVRAFDPFPGATATLPGGLCKVWQAQVLPADGADGRAPGTLFAPGKGRLAVVCGDRAALEWLQVQRAGGKRMPAAALAALPEVAAQVQAAGVLPASASAAG